MAHYKVIKVKVRQILKVNSLFFSRGFGRKRTRFSAEQLVIICKFCDSCPVILVVIVLTSKLLLTAGFILIEHHSIVKKKEATSATGYKT